LFLRAFCNQGAKPKAISISPARAALAQAGLFHDDLDGAAEMTVFGDTFLKVETSLLRAFAAGFCAQKLQGLARNAALALGLGITTLQPAQAFDASIASGLSNFTTNNRAEWVALAGFEAVAASDPTQITAQYCKLRYESLAVSTPRPPPERAFLGWQDSGNSILQLTGFRTNGGGYVAHVAPQDIYDDLIANVSIPTIFLTAASAADIANVCSITDFTIVSQRSPDGSDYATSSYHGIVFRGRQDGVLYEWEVAFSGRTGTRFINTRTAVPTTPPPTVTGLSQNSDSTFGGTQITVTGTGFGTGATVSFGGTAGTAVTVNSDTSLTVTTPARSAGTVNVTVTSNGQASANNGTADDITFAAPPTLALTIVPSDLNQTRGRPFTLVATPLVSVNNTTGRLFLRVNAPIASAITAASGIGWTCTIESTRAVCFSDASIPAGGTGNPVTVTVEIPTTQNTINGTFGGAFLGGASRFPIAANTQRVNFNAPVATTLATASLPLLLNTTMTATTPVTATGGTPDLEWSVSPTLPPGLEISRTTGQITGTPTAARAANNYTITATDARGSSDSEVVSIAVVGVPTIASISPSSGSTIGGTSVTINGANLDTATEVNFGGRVIPAVQFTSRTANAITVNSPPRVAGPGVVDISVTTLGGTSVNSANDNFTYTAPEIELSASIGGAVTDGGTNAQGERRAGSPVIVTYTVTNTGNADLTLARGTVSSPLNVTIGDISTPVASTVAGGGGTTTFSVTYTPRDVGPFSFLVSFANNDSDENPFNFTVSGTGTAPPPVLALTATPSATQQTVGRSYSFTVTPSATVAATSGTLTLTTTLPPLQGINSGTGTGWTCNVTGDLFTTGQTVTCNSNTAIAADANGNPVTISISPVGARSAFAQSFTLSGGGAATNATATAASVAVNGLPQTEVLQASTTLTRDALATPFTPIRVWNGGTAPFRWTVSPALPSGLELNEITGEITGRPTVNSPATNYVFSVTDDRGSVTTSAVATRTASITVRAPAPVITSITPQSGTAQGGTLVTIEGSNFEGATAVLIGGSNIGSIQSVTDNRITFLAAARGAGGPFNVQVVTPSATSENAGTSDDFRYIAPVLDVNFSPSTGAQTVGRPFNIVAQVAATAAEVTRPTVLDITVSTGTSLASLTGTGWSCTPDAFGADCIYSPGIVVGAGTGVSNDLNVVATFASAGIGQINMRASSPAATADSQLTNFTVNEAVVTTQATALLPLTAGVLMTPTRPVTATGGTAPIRWSVSPALLPAGLSMDEETGVITGTPSVVQGATSYTITATDARGSSDSKVVSISVAAPLPSISGISPASGPLVGGTIVTINGTNLSGATRVNFGATMIEGTDITLVSANEIRVASPARATAGNVDISVDTPAGTSTRANAFTYIAPPTATAEFLTTSIIANGNAVTRYRVTVTNPNPVPLTGIGFSQVFPSELRFVSLFNTCTGLGFVGAIGAAGDRYSFSSGTLAANTSCEAIADLTTTVPGSYNLTLSSLTSAGGDGILPTTATALTATTPPPAISGISPAFGPLVGGTTVTINGTNLSGATRVNFGATMIEAADITLVSANEIRVTSPVRATAGNVDISVDTPAGTSTRANAFTYVAPPVVTAQFSPTSILANGTAQARLTVTIRNPNAAATLRNVVLANTVLPVGLNTGQLEPAWICGMQASLMESTRSFSLSLSQLLAGQSCSAVLTVTASAAGSYTVTTGDVSSAQMPLVAGATTPTALTATTPPPAISGISPASGAQVGGSIVTISGQNFVNVTAVNFGQTGAMFEVESPTRITATVPAGSEGPVRVTVESQAGTSADVAGDEFTYWPVPRITTTAVPNGTVGAEYAFLMLQANSGTGILNFSGTGLPLGLTLSADGTLWGTPLEAGDFTLRATVTDANGQTGTADFAINIMPLPPEISNLRFEDGRLSLRSSFIGSPVTRIIEGRNLAAVSSVTLAGAPITFRPINDFQISVDMPATAAEGFNTLAVTSAAGSADIQYLYYHPLLITSISPNVGPTTGYPVTIRGRGFTGAFGTVNPIILGGVSNPSDPYAISQEPAQNVQFTVVDDTTITATIPASTLGRRSLFLERLIEADISISASSRVLLWDAPTITGMSPNFGNVAGGTQVTIQGTSFVEGMTVTFGGVPATAVEYVSRTELRATTPQASSGAGSVNVVVSSQAGSNLDTDADNFAYVNALQISSGAISDGTVGTPYSQNLSGAGGSTPYGFSATGLPDGLTLQGATVAGRPTTAGSRDVTFTLTDANGQTNTTIRRITVAQAQPTLALTAPVATTVLGGPITFTATLTGGLAPSGAVEFFDDATSLGSATVSAGAASLTTTAVAAGNRSITARYLGDTSHLTATADALAHSVTFPQPSITTATLNRGTVGSPYFWILAGAGGAEPYAFSATNLPAELTLSGNIISGTPTTAGSSNVTITLTDANNQTASATLALPILQAQPTLALTASSSTTVLGGSVTFTATLAEGLAPSGAVEFFDGVTSLGSATVSAGAASLSTAALPAGSRSITARYAGDTNHLTATASALTHSVTFPQPSITTASLSSGTVGSAYSQTLAGAGGTGPYAFSATNLPAGLTLTDNTISGTPEVAGSRNVTITLTDANNQTATAILALNIGAAAPQITSIQTGGSNENRPYGISTGGPTIRIIGAHLDNVISVTLGGRTMSFFERSATRLDFSLWQMPQDGRLDLTVTTAGGSVTTDFYIYNPVMVTAISPEIGTTTGFDLTLRGRGFTGALGDVNFAALTYGWNDLGLGTELPVTFTVVNDTTITLRVPALPEGNIAIELRKPVTPTAYESGFVGVELRDAPTITSLSPARGAAAGGYAMTITGTDLDIATQVRFGDTVVTDFVATQSEIRLTVPEGTGTVNVAVVTPGGTSANTDADDFTYIQPLAISTSALTGGTVGSAYSQTLVGAGGTEPYRFTTSALPAGLTLTGNTISGTPTTAGSTEVTVTLTDAADATLTRVLPLLVAQAQPTLALTSSNLNTVFGDEVTFTATLTGGNLPSGAVEFFDGTINLGSANVTAGVATLTTADLTVGSHSITARYAGDGNHLLATAPAITQEVGEIKPTPLEAQVIAFTIPSEPALQQGGTFSLTATATSGLPVTFTSETISVCTVTAGGSLNLVATGMCTIAANQPGDATWAAAPTVRQSVSVAEREVTGDGAVQGQLLSAFFTARANSLMQLQPDLGSVTSDASQQNDVTVNLSSRGSSVNLARAFGANWLRFAANETRDAEGSSGYYSQLSFGSYVEVNPEMKYGWMATWDIMRLSHALGSVEGQGYLLGPYAIIGLQEIPLQIEGRALFGRSHDWVTQAGSAPQSVRGNRDLIIIKGSGDIPYGNMAFSPNLSFSQVRQRSDAYVSAAGDTVESVLSLQRQAALGLDFTLDTQTRLGDLQYFGGVNYVLRDDSNSGNTRSLRYNLGFTQNLDSISTIRVEAIGERDFNSNAQSFGVAMKLDMKF
jgi:hypothetical protein